MRILGLDLATKTGWAYGSPGSIPQSDMKRMKRPDDDVSVAAAEVGRFIRDICIFVDSRPDLIVYEAPIQPFMGSSDDDERKRRIVRSVASITLPQQMVGAVHALAAVYGIRAVGVHAGTVRKHFLGRGNFGDSDVTKRKVIERCHLLKYFSPDCKDDNRADACAVWDYACATYARRAPRELHLFGERA